MRVPFSIWNQSVREFHQEAQAMRLRLLATTHGEVSADDSCPVNSCPAV